MARLDFRALVTGLLLCAMLASASAYAPITRANTQSNDSHYFPETRHTVAGTFWKYWQDHGGLTQQGYPISEEFPEASDLDGKQYTVQYFERAVFEMHPEKQPPYNVLLSQLGTFQYRTRYTAEGAPGQQANTSPGSLLFKETGHRAGGKFLDYWNKNGGLAQQGFPISDEFSEKSDLNGNTYTVQYFERAVFEMHPEKDPPYDVLLSQLGTFQLNKKYVNGAPGGEGQPQPTQVQPQATATVPVSQPTRTSTATNCEPVASSRKSTISSTGPVVIANVKPDGQEYVEIRNKGAQAKDIIGWVLRDKNDIGQSFAFPANTTLQAEQSIQIYTEPNHPYSFNSRSAIWNNCGDALDLVDNTGTVVATYAYGTHLLP